MAQTVLLSVALLIVVLSFHGALGITGCRVTRPGLEKYCHSTQHHWVQDLQGPIQRLPPPLLPGLINCRLTILNLESIRVVMRPPGRVEVIVCLVLEIKCYLLLVPVKVRVAYCLTITMIVGPLGLRVASCSAAYVEIKVQALIDVKLELAEVAEILGSVLDPVVCPKAIEIATKLNLMRDLQLVPASFFTGCQYTCTRGHPPQLYANYVDLFFVPQVTCGGAVVPWPPYPSYYLPASLVPDEHTCYYISEDDLANILLALLGRGLFNHEFTHLTVTTTLIIARISGIVCPKDLPIMLRISCAHIAISITTRGVIFDIRFAVDIGYFQSVYVSLLRVTVTMKIIVISTIDCQKGRLVFSVGAISEIRVTGTCSGSPCTVDGSLLEELFSLRAHCRDLFNEKMKIGFPWPFPTKCACSTCRDVIIVPKIVVWCCNLNYLE
nr:uncharacterized protein LOC118088398 [Zootoca vivipara]